MNQSDPKFKMSKNEQNLFNELLDNTWEAIFKLTDLISFGYDEPDEYVLSNSDHIVTKSIVYIYSMESFVYKELNLSSRN